MRTTDPHESLSATIRHELKDAITSGGFELAALIAAVVGLVGTVGLLLLMLVRAI